MVNDLINHLMSRGYECDVYYFDKLPDLNFPCSTKQINFIESIDFEVYDIIHSHLFRPDLYCALHKRRIKKSKAILISTIHTAIYDDLHYSYRKPVGSLIIPLWRAAWRRMDHVIVLTDAAKQYYKKTKFKAISVINNGRDLPEQIVPVLKSDLDLIDHLKSSYNLFGTICAMDKRKGLEQVVNLLVIRPEYAFMVVGDGAERRSLEKLAMENGVADRFKVIGFRDEGYRYLPLFELFLLPSRSEGMPLALLEAMALKVPVVCAKIPSLTSEFSAEECAFFDLDDVDSLDRACRQALFYKQQLTQKAYQNYQQKYTVSQMGGNYDTLYHSI